jgi:hypothetical protein
MLYSNGDANFSAANPYGLQGTGWGAGPGGWQQQDLQHAWQQFIAQQLAAQAQRQQTGANPWQFAPHNQNNQFAQQNAFPQQNPFVQQNPFPQQNPFLPNHQGLNAGGAAPLHVLHHIAQSLHQLAQQLGHLAAQGAHQASLSQPMANQPVGNPYFAQAGTGQAFGSGQALH